MAAAKFVALFALLQLSSAWLLPPQAENFTFDNDTANCSGSTLEEWLDVQPQPVFVDTYPGAPEPEKAEEDEDYVELELGIVGNVDPSDSESTGTVDDESEESEEDIFDSDDDLQDFIVNDDAHYKRYRRDVIGGDILPTATDAINESEEIEDGRVEIAEGNEFSEGEESDDEASSEEERDDEARREEESDDESSSEEGDESEEKDDEPYAFLRVKDNRFSEGMLTPEDRVKVMLKNFQKGRMNFFVTVSSHDEDDVDNAGTFSSQPFLIKLKGCWLEHKHNAHKICKHHHGRKHGHGRGHRRRRRHHGGRNHHHHGGDHQSERHPLAETNEVDTESSREQENNTAFDFKSHKFLEPAEGEASLCSPTQLEGWLGPESKVVIAYSVPLRGCVVIRAYVSYPINNGSMVLTSEGNEEYLQYLNCVDPNHIPEEDRDYDHDYESNDINDDVYDDGIDPANIIDNVASSEEDNDSVTTRRGRYNLRPRQKRGSSSSDESSEEEDDSNERRRRSLDGEVRLADNKREWSRQKRDSSSSDESSEEEDDSNERRRRSLDGENLHSLEHRRQMNRARRHDRRNAYEDTPHPATNIVEETSERPLNARQQRRQERKQRRQERQHGKRQGRQGRNGGGETTEASPEGVPGEGRRGRGSRRNRPNRRNKPQHQHSNRRLHAHLTDRGAKFCCKQGIQHKKASTYPNDEGSTPALNCTVVPSEVPTWASHKHPIDKDVCEGHYVRCCNEFDLEMWNTFKEKREARRAQRANREQG